MDPNQKPQPGAGQPGPGTPPSGGPGPTPPAGGPKPGAPSGPTPPGGGPTPRPTGPTPPPTGPTPPGGKPTPTPTPPGGPTPTPPSGIPTPGPAGGPTPSTPTEEKKPETPEPSGESPPKGGGGPSEGGSQEPPSSSGGDFIAPKPAKGEPYDVAIIGSGPAGFSAAVYTTRGALSTLIIGGAKWGGQLMLTTEVENYPGFESIQGPELMEKMRKHAEKFGAVMLEKDAEKVDFKSSPFKIWVDGKEYQARSVIIATGAKARWLELPSEQKYIGRGVSSCAPCDAPFFKGKKTIVVGGGDSAMEEALVLTKYAEEVRIVHRRGEFRASQVMQDRVLNNPKIKVIWDTAVSEVLGNEKVTGVKLENVKTNQTTEMPIDGVFVAIGHDPATKIFADQLELDKKGYVVVRDHTKTNAPGVFVAGDVHDWHYKQVVTAAGFGCMAAMDAIAYLGEKEAEEGS